MDYRDIQKLRAFFSAIKESHYKLTLKEIPNFATVDGQRTPVEKSYCLNLLRKLPQFQGDQFKDDDAVVRFLSDPNKRKFFFDDFKEGRIELTQALEEEPIAVGTAGEQPSGQEGVAAEQAPVGEPSTTMTGGMPSPGIATETATTAPRRVIHVIQPTGGKEGGTGTGTAATNKAARLATKAEVPSAFQKAFENEPAYKTDPTKAPPSKINPQGFKMPYAFSNFGKNVVHKAGMFLNRNIIPIARTGLGAFAGGVLTGGNPLGMLAGGVGGSTFNAWGPKALNGIANFAPRLSSEAMRSRLSSVGKKGAWRFAVLLFVGMFGLSLLTAFTGAGTPGTGTTPGGTGGTGGTGGGLDYTIPFKDPSVRPLDIRDQVRARWSNAQLQNWDTIVQQSITAGWNPAFVLALWIEETGAQGVPNYTDPLGCAVNQPTTDINISLGCLFRTGASFSNNQFADFMCRYSEGLGKPAPCQFTTNPNFPTNLKSWYSRLVPSGPGAIQTITPAPVTGAVASCPIPGGVISNYSYQYASTHPGTPGHCYGGYDYTCHCGTTGRRAKAIDVRDTTRSPSGIIVKLPQINGQDADWTLITKNYPVDQSEGGGVGNTFRAALGTDTWYLDTLHLNPTTMVSGTSYRSGAQISTTATDHVHMTMGKNITTQPVSAGSNSDCDSGWLPSDFACK